MAQFTLVAYYLLGGAYSIQLGANVWMDLFYANWSTRKKAWVDSPRAAKVIDIFKNYTEVMEKAGVPYRY